MADRFFPNAIPTTNKLNLIMLVQYVRDPDKTGGQDFCQVLARDYKTILWGWYLAHLQHFLWCELVIMEVYLRAGRQEVEIPPGLSPSCRTTLCTWMHDCLEESIKCTVLHRLTTRRAEMSNKSCLGVHCESSSDHFYLSSDKWWHMTSKANLGATPHWITLHSWFYSKSTTMLEIWFHGHSAHSVSGDFQHRQETSHLLAPTCALRLNNMNDLGDMQVDGEYKVIFYHTYLIFKVWGPATVNKPKLNDWDSGKSENTSSTLCQHIHEHLGLRWYTDDRVCQLQYEVQQRYLDHKKEVVELKEQVKTITKEYAITQELFQLLG